MSDLDDLKLGRVVLGAGRVDGRVKLQKIVYLLQQMGYSLPFDDFRLHHQGPFSRSLAWATDSLRAMGLLIEDVEVLGTDSRTGEAINQYNYSVDQNWKGRLRDWFDVRGRNGLPPVDEPAGLLAQHPRATLEVAATKLYLQSEGLTGSGLDNELRRIKGHLGQHAFDEAEQLLAELRAKKWLAT
jgi:hypothetical protein